MASYINGYCCAHKYLGNGVSSSSIDDFSVWVNEYYNLPSHLPWNVAVTVYSGGNEEQKLATAFALWNQFYNSVVNHGHPTIDTVSPSNLYMQDKKTQNAHVIEILENVRNFPNKYLATPSIFHLCTFLCGYSDGCGSIDRLYIPSIIGQFNDWLADKYPVLPNTAGWANILYIMANGDENLAISIFFSEFNDYSHKYLQKEWE